MQTTRRFFYGTNWSPAANSGQRGPWSYAWWSSRRYGLGCHAHMILPTEKTVAEFLPEFSQTYTHQKHFINTFTGILYEQLTYLSTHTVIIDVLHVLIRCCSQRRFESRSFNPCSGGNPWGQFGFVATDALMLKHLVISALSVDANIHCTEPISYRNKTSAVNSNRRNINWKFLVV